MPRTQRFALALPVLALPLAANAAQTADAAGASLAERAPGTIAFAILLTAVLCAWLLDHRAVRLRAAGTALAAAGCFALLPAFGGALDAGVLGAHVLGALKHRFMDDKPEALRRMVG
ncbi:MAG: hypothetical protein EA417_00950 [Gammaproteobacteria bacterium]|nr:MAG: hypothetical protein EA417_00950 [Gammaproteobacteria bacterium]